MQGPRSYVICMTPRSGSTLLCDLLAGTGVAGKPASYFRRQSIPSWAERLGVPANRFADEPTFHRAYLAAVLREASTKSGIRGIRLMWESAGELFALLRRLNSGSLTDAVLIEKTFGSTKYVHLSRQDKLAQAVSLYKARHSGLWHIATDGTERERTMPHRAAIYDRARLAECVAELRGHDTAWTRWFGAQNIEPTEITYEALAAEPSAVLTKLLSRLGLNPADAAVVKPETGKLSNSESVDWIERYRAEMSAPRS